MDEAIRPALEEREKKCSGVFSLSFFYEDYPQTN
jgi:hypothetical protein